MKNIFIRLFRLYPFTGGNVSNLGKVDGVSHWEFWKNSEVKPPRNRILVNINEVTNEKAFIMGKWKYSISTYSTILMDEYSYLITLYFKFTNNSSVWWYSGSKSAKLKYGGYAGRDTALTYNLTLVLHSPVHKVLKRYEEKKFNEKTFLQLRRKADIAAQGSCKNRTQAFDSDVLPCFSTGDKSVFLMRGRVFLKLFTSFTPKLTVSYNCFKFTD